jgi:hypothetical protein
LPEIRHGQVVEGHLGGYVPGGDPDTHYPDLWTWLVQEQGVKSVLDVGAGDGVAVDFFAGLGCLVLGIEGIEQEHDSIIQHDYTTGPWVPAIRTSSISSGRASSWSTSRSSSPATS